MTATKAPAPPGGLGKAGKSLWRKVTADFELSPAESALLEAMCAAYDRHQDATAVVAREGLTVPGRFAPQQHPCVIIARDSANLMRQLAHQLRVELEADEGKVDRPGPRPSTRIKAQKSVLAARRASQWGAGA